VKPKLPENFEEDTWSKLQAAVKAVHNKQPVATSLEELYRVSFTASRLSSTCPM
jgi:cullin-4